MGRTKKAGTKAHKDAKDREITNDFFNYGLEESPSDTPPSSPPPVPSAPSVAQSTVPLSASSVPLAATSAPAEVEDNKGEGEDDDNKQSHPATDSDLRITLREAAYEEGQLLFRAELAGAPAFVAEFTAAFLHVDPETRRRSWHIDEDVLDLIVYAVKNLDGGPGYIEGISWAHYGKASRTGKAGLFATTENAVIKGIRDFYIEGARACFTYIPKNPDFSSKGARKSVELFILLGFIVLRAAHRNQAPLNCTSRALAKTFYKARSSFMAEQPNITFLGKPISAEEARANAAYKMKKAQATSTNMETTGAQATTTQEEASKAHANAARNKKKRDKKKAAKGKQAESNTEEGTEGDLPDNNDLATAEPEEDEDEDMYGPARPVAATAGATRTLPSLTRPAGSEAVITPITRPAGTKTGITSNTRPPRARPHLTRPAGSEARSAPLIRPFSIETGSAINYLDSRPPAGLTRRDRAQVGTALTTGLASAESSTASSVPSTNPPAPTAAEDDATHTATPRTVFDVHGVNTVFRLATGALARHGVHPIVGTSEFLGVPTRRQIERCHVAFRSAPPANVRPAAANVAAITATLNRLPAATVGLIPAAVTATPSATAHNVGGALPDLPRATGRSSRRQQALLNDIHATLLENEGLPPSERRAAWAAARQRLLRGETLAAARGQMGLRPTATPLTQASLDAGARPGEGQEGRFDIGSLPGWLGELEDMQVQERGKGVKSMEAEKEKKK